MDEELKKMATRMQRIKGMITKERKIAGGVVGREFDQELDNIIDENSNL